jgi:DNA polymerase III epsilon subunit-like protein
MVRMLSTFVLESTKKKKKKHTHNTMHHRNIFEHLLQEEENLSGKKRKVKDDNDDDNDNGKEEVEEEEEEDDDDDDTPPRPGFQYVSKQLTKRQLKKLKKKGFAIQPEIQKAIESKLDEEKNEHKNDDDDDDDDDDDHDDDKKKTTTKKKKKKKEPVLEKQKNVAIELAFPLIKVKKDVKLGIKDVQDLLLWACSDSLYPLVPNPVWAMLQNKMLIKKVCLIVHGFNAEEFESAGREELYLHLTDHLKKVHIGPLSYEVNLRNCGCVRQLLLAPKPKSMGGRSSSKNNNNNNNNNNNRAGGSGGLSAAHLKQVRESPLHDLPVNHDIEQFLLSESDRLHNGFPVMMSSLSDRIVTYKFSPAASTQQPISMNSQIFINSDNAMIDRGSKKSEIVIFNGLTFILEDEPHVHAPWVSTHNNHNKPADEVEKNLSMHHSKIGMVFGLDCEMCLTASGYEATRVSLVAMDGSVLYDSIIKPEHPVIDHLTRWSGITQKILASATKRLVDVQRDLLELIPADAILLGHGLENDLKALKIYHQRIIDTSLLYPHPRGFPYKPSLRHLALQILRKQIQVPSQHQPQQSQQQPQQEVEDEGKEKKDPVDGHDSTEDAITCVELLKAKLLLGASLGRNDLISVFELLAGKKKSSMIASAEILKGFMSGSSAGNAAARIVSTLDDAVKQLASELKNQETELIVAALSTLPFADYAAIPVLANIISGSGGSLLPGTLFLILSDPDSKSKHQRDRKLSSSIPSEDDGPEDEQQQPQPQQQQQQDEEKKKFTNHAKKTGEVFVGIYNG